MKFRHFFSFTLFAFAPFAQAAPNFWNNVVTPTPTFVQPPPIHMITGHETPTPTPMTAPALKPTTPTPTPLPGLNAINPTQAAIFSALIPGSGQVYDGDPLRGLVFAGLFGVGLWQTLDNFALHTDPSNPGQKIVKDEDLGSLFGLATLAVYGFGVQDAYNGAVNYNKKHYLTLSIGLQPIPTASLAFRF